MRTYTATAPNGQTFTRKSAKPFTHAVLVDNTTDLFPYDGSATQGWGAWGFTSGNPAALLAKARGSYSTAIVVPVTAA